MIVPWLPQGNTATLPGRGEVFYRRHQHEDPNAPTVLLLHGWTASSDLQFFTAYEELATHCSFVGIDHRGHGRSMRGYGTYELEDAADDAAALVRLLGLKKVILVGYSMGGPISLLLAQRHPDLVAGIVVQATALEWRATVAERVRWKTIRMLGPIVRSWAFPSTLRRGLERLAVESTELQPFVPWVAGEITRNSASDMVSSGQALGRYDARPWAESLRGHPAAVLITSKDRLVKPSKQRALAAALNAHVEELAADHSCTLVRPREYSELTSRLVKHVAAQARQPV